MQRKPFGDYTCNTVKLRDYQQCMDELTREVDVRRRIFDEWVSKGRLSWTDAHDRLERLMTLMAVLVKLAPEEWDMLLDQAEHSKVAAEPVPA